jgi:hypothetical protein
MIEIEINKKKKPIKNYSELTLKEYKEVIELIKENISFNIMNYLAYQSGYKYDDFLLQEVKGLKLLSDIIGTIRLIKGESEVDGHFIEGLPLKMWGLLNDKYYDLRNIKIKSKVGYRTVIEQYTQSKPTYLDLYSFTYATILNMEANKSFDYESILEIQKELEKQNAYHVLGNGAFFLTNLVNGEKKGERFLRVLRTLLIKIKG